MSITFLYPPLSLHVHCAAPEPECTRDPDCPENLACLDQTCQDPCSSKTCGVNAECRVQSHTAVCTCRSGFIGDPSTVCRERKHDE
jgi:hypothetical protein